MSTSTYGQCNFLTTGDLIARVGTRPDFVEHEFLHKLDMLPNNYVEDTFLDRVSQDKVANEHGNYLLNFCKASGLRIMNDRIGNDGGIGKFTCVTDNGCSVIDYVLCRPELMYFVNSFVVLEPNIFSDHCAINFSFGKLKHIDDVADDDISQHIEYTYTWNVDEKEEFIQSLCGEERLSTSNSHSLIVFFTTEK